MRSSSSEANAQLMPARGTPSDLTPLAPSSHSPRTRAEFSPLTSGFDSHASDAEQTHSRMDVISGRWTLFASHRNDRPNEFVTSSSSNPTTEGCPFCEGNEEATPEPILVVGTDEDSGNGEQIGASRGWGIRVIPNKYPAVDPLPPGCDESDWAVSDCSGGSAKSAHRGSETHESSLFPARRTFGGHEVFIESPEHFTSLADLDLSHVVTLLNVYQGRLNHWRANPAIQYVSLFKNVGPAAGASLHHPHSQLIALSELPRSAKTMADRMQLHHARTGCCLQCDVLRAELKAKQRIVAVTDSLVAYCPFASHLPMLLRVTTRRHVDQFEQLNEQEIDELARLVRRSIGWLRALYPGIAYNFLIHTRPPGVPDTDAFHWSFELFPRLTQTAGFEWSCDCTINPTLPEVAAEQLHAVAMRENPLRC